LSLLLLLLLLIITSFNISEAYAVMTGLLFSFIVYLYMTPGNTAHVQCYQEI